MKTNSLSLLAFLFVLLVAVFAAEAADLRDVRITGVSYSGSGCPQDTVSTAFSPDTSSFSILYSAMNLNVGGPTIQSTDTRSCEVQIRVRLPFGYGINVESADFRGFVSLDGGVVAHNEVQTQIDSNPLAALGFGVQVFAGPRQENYLLRAQRPNLQLPKALLCLPLKRDRTLTVKTRIKMTGGEGARLGMMSVDSADGRIEQKYLLSLRRCF